MIDRTVFAERLGMIVGVALVLMMTFTTVAPFFVSVPQASVRLIDQQQTILQSVFMVLVGYLWGQSAGNRMKDATIDTLAKTAQTAGAALAPPTADAVVELKPGEAARVTAEDPKP